MQLPEDDDKYLADKGFASELLPDGKGALLVLKGYAVDGKKYDRSATDLMVRLPAGYPNAKLDNFYADPPVKLKNGGYPDRADHFETHCDRRWQRFSRHLPDWRVGLDGLATLLTFAQRELRNGG